jgi:two-component system sensor histidine kinase/response regulator
VVIRLDKKAIDISRVTIQFRVTDTGIGIAPENLDLIFDPFEQETQSSGNDYGGTGLGLAITKRLVELHQSNISVASKPGVGTEFSFVISFAIADIEEARSEQRSMAAQDITEQAVSLQGMRVLLVDDNKMNLLIASKFLKKWQVEPDEAMSGQQAVEMTKRTNYDLVIMDLQMPGMDGFEATRMIKRTHPHLPIFALTADAMPETHSKAFAAGMCDYLTKPFVPQVLFEKIAKYYVAVEH